jgi:hypothetical protein
MPIAKAGNHPAKATTNVATCMESGVVIANFIAVPAAIKPNKLSIKPNIANFKLF